MALPTKDIKKTLKKQKSYTNTYPSGYLYKSGVAVVGSNSFLFWNRLSKTFSLFDSKDIFSPILTT